MPIVNSNTADCCIWPYALPESVSNPSVGTRFATTHGVAPNGQGVSGNKISDFRTASRPACAAESCPETPCSQTESVHRKDQKPCFLLSCRREPSERGRFESHPPSTDGSTDRPRARISPSIMQPTAYSPFGCDVTFVSFPQQRLSKDAEHVCTRTCCYSQVCGNVFVCSTSKAVAAPRGARKPCQPAGRPPAFWGPRLAPRAHGAFHDAWAGQPRQASFVYICGFL
jgi:hypothetical protein